MNIKSTVHLIKNAENSLKAMVDVNLNDEFVIKGIKVLEGEKGLFVAMPQRKVGKDFEQSFFPITKESREQLHQSVLESYEQKIAEQAQKTEKGQSKGNKKGQTNGKQSGNKSHKADDNVEQSAAEQEEQVDEGPTMSM